MATKGTSTRNMLPVLLAACIVAAVFPAALAQAPTATALFAHLAVGGGYTTTFTLLNTGSTDVVGSLILTGQDGNALDVTLSSPAIPDGEPGSAEQVRTSNLPITIPPGGTSFITASDAGGTRVGWARVESTGGSLGGVATFQLIEGNVLQTIAGVLSSNTTANATIPVDDDDSQKRFTGYAVANPNNEAITIRILEVPTDGDPAKAVTRSTIPLNPGEQRAAFFFQARQPAQDYKGSAILIGDGGKQFSVVALVQVQGTTLLYTAIPVIPSKTPFIN